MYYLRQRLEQHHDPDYGGPSRHARCFLHTTNLVAKSLLRAFDVKWGNQLADVEMTVLGYAKGNNLIPYYSGVVVGVYATSNGKYGEGAFETYVSRWRYTGLEQVREFPSDQGPVTWD